MPTIERKILDEAAAQGIVSPDQAERLWTFLSERVDAPSVEPAGTGSWPPLHLRERPLLPGGNGRDRRHVPLHDPRVAELRRLGSVRHRGRVRRRRPGARRAARAARPGRPLRHPRDPGRGAGAARRLGRPAGARPVARRRFARGLPGLPPDRGRALARHGTRHAGGRIRDAPAFRGAVPGDADRGHPLVHGHGPGHLVLPARYGPLVRRDPRVSASGSWWRAASSSWLRPSASISERASRGTTPSGSTCSASCPSGWA